jgi:hypothetical protein
MSQFDIMPWDSPGGFKMIDYAPMKSGAAFYIGEPVGIDNVGYLRECADAAVPQSFGGIALAPLSYSRNGTSTTRDPYLGGPYVGAATTGTSMIPYVAALPGQRFIFRRMNDTTTSHILAGTTTYAFASAIALIGQEAGLQLDSGAWQLDIGQAADTEIFRIVSFLDSNKTNIRRSGNAASYVVAQVLHSQFTGLSDAAGSLAPVA